MRDKGEEIIKRKMSFGVRREGIAENRRRFHHNDFPYTKPRERAVGQRVERVPLTSHTMINRHSGNGEGNTNNGETDALSAQLASENESVWIRIGKLSEAMNEAELASYAYENVLRHNSYNIRALTQVAALCRVREQYTQAVSYFRRILEVDETNGDIWSELGHCYLMTDDLQSAYQAYQNALYHLKNPKDTKLWYGIGILYDRYGSFEHAEEAFTAVLKLAPQFEKAHEIFFRLGIIYKQQGKYKESLEVSVNLTPATLFLSLSLSVCGWVPSHLYFSFLFFFFFFFFFFLYQPTFS